MSETPYVGPRPFTSGEETLFFGREYETKDLVSLILSHPVIVLCAASGAGKTSLLNAKIVPALLKRGCEVFSGGRVGGDLPNDLSMVEVRNIFVFNALITLRWEQSERTPLTNQKPQAFVPTNKDAASRISTFTECFARGKESLRQEGQIDNKHQLPAVGEDGLVPRVLVFDQFEEIFTKHQDRWNEKEGFFNQLGSLFENDDNMRVVFAMREEYLASLNPYAAILPDRLRTQYRLEGLRKESALLAIEGPVKDTQRYYGKGAAEKLVDNLLRPAAFKTESKGALEFVEPLHLQIVCRNLWQSLDADAKEVTQGMIQDFGDVDHALASYYEGCLQETARSTRIDERRLRMWFSEKLILPDGSRNLIYRDETMTAGMPNSVIDELDLTHHLLRSDLRGSSRWYELSHDRFITPIRRSNDNWFSRHILQMAMQWVRQHKALVSSLVVGALVMVLAGVIYFVRIGEERNKAVEERRKAIATKQAADKLLNFIEKDLIDTFVNLNRLDELGEINKRIIEFYNNHPPENDLDAKRAQGWALIVASDLFYRQKREPENVAEKYLQALTIFRDVVNKGSPRPEYQYDVAVAYERLGGALKDQGKLDEALNNYRASLEKAQNATKQDSAQATWRHELSIVYANMGDVQTAQGNLTEALASREENLKICEHAAAEDPKNVGWQLDLAHAYASLGQILLDRGEFGRAEDSYNKSLTASDNLQQSNPGWQSGRSLALERLGDLASSQGKLEEAFNKYDESRRIREDLRKQNPNNTDWLRALSTTYAKLGDVRFDQGNLQGANARFIDYQEIMLALTLRDPNNMDWKRALSVSYARIGNVLRAQGNLSDAYANYAKSLAIRRELVAKDKDNAAWKSDLAGNLQEVGDVLRAQGELSKALDNYRESLDIRSKLAREDPTNVGRTSDLGESLERVGDVLHDQWELDGAFENYNKSLEVRSTLTEQDPSNAGWRNDRAGNVEKIGDVLRDQGNLAEAYKCYNDSLQIREALADQDKTNAGWQSHLADNLEKIGGVFQSLEDWKNAQEKYCDSFAIHQALGNQDPSNAQWQAGLAYSYFHVAVASLKVTPAGQPQARVDLERGRTILSQLKEQKGLTATQQKWLDEIESQLAELDKQVSSITPGVP